MKNIVQQWKYLNVEDIRERERERERERGRDGNREGIDNVDNKKIRY